MSATTWINAWASDEYGVNATSAVLSTRMLTATSTALYYQRTPSAGTIGSAGATDFFNLPASEYYWTPKVVASMYQGRFVVVMPSFDSQAKDCLRGHLNIAISRTSDPTKSWYRYRITQTDAWTDDINIGFSDNKVVLTVNEWDLSASKSTCMGTAYEGARIKVLDWADLLDGSALTVRDVSPTGRTSYFGWMPIATVPGTSSTSAGNTVRLVGERKSTTWGDVAYATVTGSAVSGSAKVATNVNLTSARGLAKLSAPPSTMAAFNGPSYLDERIQSATARGGRLFFTSHATCKTDVDITFRACARAVELSLATTTPTVVEDALFVETAFDTFLPFVGMARDGTVFFVMSRSDAGLQGPIDVYVTARDPGERIVGGATEIRFYRADGWPMHHPGVSGGIVPDPTDTTRVFAAYAAVQPGYQAGDYFASGRISRLRANLVADPSGTAVVNYGTGWATGTTPDVYPSPSADSPILWMRWSASPTTNDYGFGPELMYSDTAQSTTAFGDDFGKPSLGGTYHASTYTVYMQWGTADGRWSTPVAYPISVETDPPTIGPAQARFRTGTVGVSAPMLLSWAPAADAISGVHHLYAAIFDGNRTTPTYKSTLAPTATSFSGRIWTGTTTTAVAQAVDNAGNGGDTGLSLTLKAYQESSSTIAWSSGWTTSSKSSFLKGAARYATKAGATTKFTFTGRAVAFVTTLGPTRGKAEIWVDGVLATTVDLYRSTTAYRQIAWQTSWPTSGSHIVRVKVLGTPGRPRVDVDAFLKM